VASGPHPWHPEGVRTEKTQKLPTKKTQQLPATIAIRQTRRLVIAVIGGIVLGAGLVLLVTPGPGFLVVILGLTILSWEFSWAKRLLHQAKTQLKKMRAARRAP
jgi:uncharacterized protein (TIGR02611 family)